MLVGFVVVVVGWMSLVGMVVVAEVVVVVVEFIIRKLFSESLESHSKCSSHFSYILRMDSFEYHRKFIQYDPRM